jgi:hypothetical protein
MKSMLFRCCSRLGFRRQFKKLSYPKSGLELSLSQPCFHLRFPRLSKISAYAEFGIEKRLPQHWFHLGFTICLSKFHTRNLVCKGACPNINFISVSRYYSSKSQTGDLSWKRACPNTLKSFRLPEIFQKFAYPESSHE